MTEWQVRRIEQLRDAKIPMFHCYGDNQLIKMGLVRTVLDQTNWGGNSRVELVK